MLDFFIKFISYISTLCFMFLFVFLWFKIGTWLAYHINKKGPKYLYTYSCFLDDFVNRLPKLIQHIITIVLLISISLTVVRLFYTNKTLFFIISTLIQLFALISFCCGDNSLFNLIKSKFINKSK